MFGLRTAHRSVCLLAIIAFVAGNIPAFGAPNCDWQAIVGTLENQYYQQFKRTEAMSDLEGDIERCGNDFRDEEMSRVLAMVKEYFRDVDQAGLAQFQRIVGAMFLGRPNRRIDAIVNFFSGAPSLYRAASDAKREYFRPVRMNLMMDKVSINIGEQATFKVLAFNKHDMQLDLGRDQYIVEIEDKSVAEIVGGGAVRGRRAGETNVLLWDTARNPMDKAKIHVEDGKTILSLSPQANKLEERETVELTLSSNQVLDNMDLRFEFDRGGFAEYKRVPLSKDATTQVVEVKAIRPSPDQVLLNVWGPGDSHAVAVFRIKPVDPELFKPSMKWAIATSVISAGLITVALVKNSDGDNLRDEAALESDPAKNAQLNSDADDAYSQSTLFGWLGAVSLAAPTYLWYRYYQSNQDYNRRKTEYQSYSSRIQFQMSPQREIAVAIRF